MYNGGIKMKKIIGLIIGLIVLTSMLSGCEEGINLPDGTFIERTSLDGGEIETTQELKKFDNVNELRQFLQLNSVSETPQYDMGLGGVRTMEVAEGAVEIMMDSAAPAAGKSADDYSETNIQVKGVDEADFVKNDGRYIYIIADNKLVIVDAYDAENAEIVSETKIADKSTDYYDWEQAKQIFINEDKLVVFVEARDKTYYFERYDIVPRQSYKQKTYIYTYDISDRKDPELVEEYSITGRYFQSRMIGDIIYVVTQEGVQDGVYINEPMVARDATVIEPEIYYFDNPEQNYQFNTITSIDISNEEVVDSKTFMLGYSNTLMVSEDNIYIAYQKQKYWRFWSRERYEEERFYDIILPLLEGEIESDVEAVLDKSLSEEEKWKEISVVLSDFYERLEDDDDLQDEYEDMFDEIRDKLEEYDMKKVLEERKTVIHKIGINDGKLDYAAKGEVYGSLLNQFSLDEHKGNLRLATTVSVWNNRGRIQYNNVYVLDDDMDKIGEIGGIAEDERIYSTRFIGDRLYMVTFKQIDPFFVIDLSDPTNPEILGELKIPGWSSYLHPYDENHIIGVGKEDGVKVALFDVTDVKNPKEIDKYEIGGKYSDSAALHEHKAFLFSKEKNLLVLPVTEVERKQVSPYSYSNTVWNGAYVFHVDEDGFDKLGKVEHSSSKSDYYYWRREASVMRSLYMDDNLYTISDQFIKMNDLSDLEELNSIKLPYNTESRYYYG